MHRERRLNSSCDFCTNSFYSNQVCIDETCFISCHSSKLEQEQLLFSTRLLNGIQTA